MIRTSRSNFYIDIRDAEFIPKDVMDTIKREVGRAAKMMPAQDVLELAIKGASKSRDMDDTNDQALIAAERENRKLQKTVDAMKYELQSQHDKFEETVANIRTEFASALKSAKK